MAITNLGQRVGGAAVPLFAQLILTRSQGGWRSAAGGLGLLTWGVALVPVILWLRRQPSDLGLAPDGDATSHDASAGRQQPQPSNTSFTLMEALRTRTFYVLLLAFCLFTFVNTGILFNLLPLLNDRGLTSSQAIGILSSWSLVGIPVTLGVGFMAERLPLRYLMVGAYLGAALGVLVLIQTDGVPMGLLFALIHGSFFAAGLFLQNLVLADYYGPAHLGAIRGLVTPVMMVSNALGPLAATLVFDIRESYSLILWVDLSMLTLIALGTLLAAPPRRNPAARPLA
jgi:cyanate permease